MTQALANASALDKKTAEAVQLVEKTFMNNLAGDSE